MLGALSISIFGKDVTDLNNYTKSCDRGNSFGCANLGLMYGNGEGTQEDKFKAVELFTKSCEGKNALGCFNLGIMHNNVEGIRQDNSKAKELFAKACDLHYENRCKGYAILNK